MRRYKYLSINGKDQIRLLHLLPGPASAEIRIQIETVTLSADQFPQYEALSYAWGSAETLSSIVVTVDYAYESKTRGHSLEKIVNSSSSRSISVTKNLAEALPYLRDATKPRTLWIDAICIDQSNGKEKGEQVSRMGEIFKSSSRVLVWLGPEMSASSAVIKFLNELSCKVRVDWATRDMSSRPGVVKDSIEMTDSFGNKEELVDGLSQLLTRPRFERLWVWQEIRAKDNAVVICSYDRILWQDLRSATYALIRSGRCRKLSRPSLFLLNMAEASLGDRLDSLSSLTSRCICADPRDRLFALKSLLHYPESDAITPDYEKSTNEVYRDVIVECALNLGKLDPLRLCDVSTKLEESPSWVPNWSSLKENLIIISFHASGRSICEAKVGMENMEVAGTYCATVTQVESLFDADASDMEVMSKISEVVSLHDMNAPYIGGGNMLSAYCCTLFYNNFSETFLPPRSDRPSFEHACGTLRAILAQNGDYGLEITPLILAHVGVLRDSMAGQTIFMTREGYIGTSGLDARLGDQVVVFIGCDSPMLLRPARGSYQVVGQCYVQGFMCAEALLGPMSEGWEFVYRHDQNSGRFDRAFIHKPSGRIQLEDPRLGRLPEGWRVHHEREDLYINNRTGEYCGKAYAADPRMTSEELRLRGVDMRTFRLV